MGGESSWIAGAIERRLGNFLENNQIASVFPQETAFAAWSENPYKVRKPDVMVFRRGRLGRLPRGLIKMAPDLAIEVVSPGDDAEKLAIKLQDYDRAAIQLVWVIDPVAREAHIFRRDERPEIVKDDATLDGEDILPGFRLNLKELFELAAGVE
jgi:Uma2 family endonuclease